MILGEFIDFLDVHFSFLEITEEAFAADMKRSAPDFRVCACGTSLGQFFDAAVCQHSQFVEVVLCSRCNLSLNTEKKVGTKAGLTRVVLHGPERIQNGNGLLAPFASEFTVGKHHHRDRACTCVQALLASRRPPVGR